MASHRQLQKFLDLNTSGIQVKYYSGTEQLIYKMTDAISCQYWRIVTPTGIVLCMGVGAGPYKPPGFTGIGWEQHYKIDITREINKC